MDININSQKGFTLIELLTAVAILTILAAIAIPTYRGYQKSASRSEATTNLTALAMCLDEYYAQEGSFSGVNATYEWKYSSSPQYTASNGNALSTFLNNCFKPKKASGGQNPRYDYKATVALTSYIANATGRGGTIVSGDAMGIDQDGGKSGSWPK